MSTSSQMLVELMKRKLQSRPHLTMRSVAKLSNLNSGLLWRYLKGQRTMNFDTAVRLSQLLGAQPQESIALLAQIISEKLNLLDDTAKLAKDGIRLIAQEVFDKLSGLSRTAESPKTGYTEVASSHSESRPQDYRDVGENQF